MANNNQSCTYQLPQREPDCSLDLTPWDVNEIEKKRIIGKDGKYFKMTTENYDLEYIWYDIETNKINFWGHENDCESAKNTIITRINKFKYEDKDPTVEFHLDLDDNKKAIFIGKHGFYLKQTSTKYSSKIWHDKNSDFIKIWGFPENANLAQKFLINRMNQIKNC